MRADAITAGEMFVKALNTGDLATMRRFFRPASITTSPIAMLQFHPDVTLSDKHAYRPLDNAVRMGREDAALFLPEAEPKERQTPEFLEGLLGGAIAKDQSRLVESLLRHGAPANGSLPTGATGSCPPFWHNQLRLKIH
jgi:hypothetical protein